ncbi:MAG: molybdopterin molybdotransferase MoeA [Mariprofundaceae bacterium]|nr:molybdopterin molybdotransferase MoeA [Mariprofundaceae bacterium]
MNYLSVSDAQEVIFKHIHMQKSEYLSLHASLNRILAEDVISNRNHPPYDVSAMDGYAVRFDDVKNAMPKQPVRLHVVDDIRAGNMPNIKVLQGRAARIMTGAPTPQGVDTVIRCEDTQDDGNDVLILIPPKQGANIRPMGENLMDDKIVLNQGTLITPGVLAILAMVKQKKVSVFAQPTVAILSSGDELEALDEAVDDNKIPDANSHALYAQCKALGIEPILLGIARDNPIELRAKLAQGLKYDVLLASGGVSVGHHDFMRPTLDALGITMHFWRVAMRPGHPLAFGTTEHGTAVFGLPGNPVSSMVCFEQFVSPALRQMMGHKKIFRRTIQARLGHDLNDRTGRAHFIRVSLEKDAEGAYLAYSTGSQGSGILMSMAVAQGFVVVPESSDGLREGDGVQVQLLQGMDFQEGMDV